jgi:hypothetical protein
MGYVATKASAIKGSSAYLATVLTIVVCRIDAIDEQWADTFFVQLELFSWRSEPQYYRRFVQKAGHALAVSISTPDSQSARNYSCMLQTADLASFAPPIQL